MRFPIAAVFGAPIGENAQQRHIVFLIKRKNAIIKHVVRHQRILAVVEFGKRALGIGVDEGLAGRRRSWSLPMPQTARACGQEGSSSRRGQHSCARGCRAPSRPKGLAMHFRSLWPRPSPSLRSRLHSRDRSAGAERNRNLRSQPSIGYSRGGQGKSLEQNQPRTQ